MNEDKVDSLLSAVESTHINSERQISHTTLDVKGVMTTADPIRPIVEQMGSAYTAQNTVTVSNMPHQKDSTDLSDVNYTYENAVKKPYYITTFTVNSTDTVGTLKYTFNYPSTYFAANHVLQNIGGTFKSFRGDLHLLVSVQGTPFAQGALAAVVVYGADGGSYTSTAQSYCEMLYKHKAILDFSDNSSTTDLIVPFRYHYNSIDPFLTAHKIEFRIFSQLAGINAVSVTVSAFVENPVFRFLRPIDNTELLKETQGLINVTTINNTMGDIVDSTLPTHLTGDNIDITPNLMDAVPITTNPSPMVVKYNSMNNANNPFPVEKPTYMAGAERISDQYTYGTNMDEMDVKTIIQRDQFVATFNVSTTTTPNSAIFATFVTPCRYWNVANTYGPPMDYITSQMRYWRGGLKYKFRFFMNRFQSLKLYAAMFYKDTEPSVLVDFSTSHGVVLDIGGDRREVEIEIPYNAETAWLYTPYLTNQDLTSTTQTYALGKIALYAMTNLVSPTGSPTSVTCVVSLSASDDFEYASYQSTTSVAQAIMLSSPSSRTNGDIVDVVPSLKIPLKKYFKRLYFKNDVDLNKYRVVGYAMQPGNMRTGTIAAGPFDDGVTTLTFPRTYKVPLTALYNGSRGGVTARIEMSYQPRFATTKVLPINLVPFCVYISTPDWVVTPTTYGPGLANALNKYFGTNWETSVDTYKTPFTIQPINPVNYTAGIQAIFEVDCPYNFTTKYCRHDFPAQSPNGIICWGWLLPIDSEWGEESVYGFSNTVYTKLSDDSRLGLAEAGAHLFTPNNQWIPI